MTQNFIKRLLTSGILLIILFIVIYSNIFIFVLSLLIVGFLVCLEFNTILIKLVGNFYLPSKKLNSKFLILMWIPFIYMFFIFCFLSFDIYKMKGPTFFLFIISICFFSDIGGYIFGKVIGGKKLTKISPNKTISGSIGSFVFSLIPIILFTKLDHLKIELDLYGIIFSLLISLVSQFGDLLISYLKRKAKIKDTGKILPGHGGILDRVDGIIIAIPFSYFLIKIF